MYRVRHTSIILDFSRKSFPENVRALKEVVDLAHPHGISVEGKLGAIGRVDSITSEGLNGSFLTEPEDAGIYVEETGIDLLAVSIRNAHGLHKKLPILDFNLLRKIRSAVSVPLVLHEGSGTPQEDLQKAISMGIAKVNVASELVLTARNSLM